MIKSEKKIVKEELEECSEVERDLFMCNMRAREALLSALPENEYSQVKSLQTSHEIWKALESTFEGDIHAKRIRLLNWIYAFQKAKMMEDEYVRSHIARISKIVAGIRSHGGTKEEDEAVWKILKILTPPFKQVAQMIQLLIPCSKDFTKEMLLGRSEAGEVDLRQFGDLARVKIAFSALNIRSNLTRSASTRGDFAGSNRFDEDKKIEEGTTLLARRGREKDDKKIFKCWTCDKFGHYTSKCPKREKTYKGKFKPRRDRNYLHANEVEEFYERGQSESDDELRFVAIKEDDFDKETQEERALVSQVEKKSDWIIESGCSHHMTGDMNKFVKFKTHDGGIFRVSKMQPVI